MFLSALLIAGSVGVTPAPGWSYPIITTDMWGYSSLQQKTLQVTGADTLHQAWASFNQDPRVGYKAYLPDGTVIHPETMISNDVWSGYTTGTLVGEDSVVIFWGETAPDRYYTVRDSIGGVLVPTGLYVSAPYSYWAMIEASSDSLGRLHSVFETTLGPCYMVYKPGVGEVRRDTLPSDHPRYARILVDGDRVHIVFLGDDGYPDYMQYDLDGNVTVVPTDIIDESFGFDKYCTITADSHGDLHCLYYVYTGGHYHLSLFKLDGETGEVLIYDKELWDPSYGVKCSTILSAPSGELLYLMWLEGEYYNCYVYFSVIDRYGNPWVEPYAAYDYSGEEQTLNDIVVATNEEGDVFAAWTAYFPDVHLNAYNIVMGWMDQNWVGIEEGAGSPVETDEFELHHSINPFQERVGITAEGYPVPGQLAVYDLSGRIVRTLFRRGENSFLWDGCSSEGEELPAGTYMIQGASAGRLTSLSVVKL